jgi:hypothetical protein
MYHLATLGGGRGFATTYLFIRLQKPAKACLYKKGCQ